MSNCKASWLARLLPNREVPPDIGISNEVLRPNAFRVQEAEQGSASLQPGMSEPLSPIYEFGGDSYTEEKERTLSENNETSNQRHGNNFADADMLRFEAMNQEILDDGISNMLRSNRPDVFYTAYTQAFLKSAVRMFQHDNEMRRIAFSDAEAREKATRYSFKCALRVVRESGAALKL